MNRQLSEVVRVFRTHVKAARRKGVDLTVGCSLLGALDEILADCEAETLRLETIELEADAASFARRAREVLFNDPVGDEPRFASRRRPTLATIDGRPA